MTYGIIRDHAKSYPNPDACRPLLWPYMYAASFGGSRPWLLTPKERYSLDSQLSALCIVLKVSFNSVLHLSDYFPTLRRESRIR